MRDRVNSESLSGLERRDEVSPEGMSSSVVVTGSVMTEASGSTRFSGRGLMDGQSAMLGPRLSSAAASALPKPL